EFAEDLQRFLDDRPILARRPTLAQRARRWARRHRPLVVALAASGGLLLLAAAIWLPLDAAEQRRLAAQERALANDREQFARDQARDKQRTAAKLYKALLNGAAALRSKGAPGYRRTVWRDLTEAAGLDVPGKDTARLRDEILACLGD